MCKSCWKEAVEKEVEVEVGEVVGFGAGVGEEVVFNSTTLSVGEGNLDDANGCRTCCSLAGNF